MKSFKLFLTMMGCLSLVVQTAFAGVSYDRKQLKQLNQSATMQFMADSLKDVFPTQEDHRVINYEFVKMQKLSENWLWRFEVQGDSIAFRVNGKVQALFKPVSNDGRSFEMNGKRIDIKKGMSFRAFLAKVEGAMVSNSRPFERLFIERAEAIFPLLIAAGIGGLIGYSFCATPASAGERECRSGNCGRNGNRRSCVLSRTPPFSSSQMVTSFSRWNPNRCRPSRGYDYNRAGCFHNVQSCYYWKVEHPRARQHAFGRRLSPQQGRNICEALERHWQCRNGGTPQPQAYPQAQPQDPGFGQIVGETCPKEDCNNIARLANQGNNACRQKYEQQCRTPDYNQYDSER